MVISDLEWAYQTYKHKKYDIISDRMMDVESKNVHKVVKKGRSLILCSCQNHARFCDSPAMCRHKLFFLLFPLFEHYDKKIEELINILKINKTLSEKNRLDFNGIIMLLEDMRRIK